jgi:hypothetical protein
VQKYLPEWQNTEQPITIRQLLTHTSGLRDAFTLLGISPPREDGVSVNDQSERLKTAKSAIAALLPLLALIAFRGNAKRIVLFVSPRNSKICVRSLRASGAPRLRAC